MIFYLQIVDLVGENHSVQLAPKSLSFFSQVFFLPNTSKLSKTASDITKIKTEFCLMHYPDVSMHHLRNFRIWNEISYYGVSPLQIQHSCCPIVRHV